MESRKKRVARLKEIDKRATVKVNIPVYYSKNLQKYVAIPE